MALALRRRVPAGLRADYAQVEPDVCGGVLWQD
jgi:hypothetical protein